MPQVDLISYPLVSEFDRTNMFTFVFIMCSFYFHNVSASIETVAVAVTAFTPLVGRGRPDGCYISDTTFS